MLLGEYCGELTGKEVVVEGYYAVITFHSDYSLQRRGFRIVFTAVQPRECNWFVTWCPLNTPYSYKFPI